MTEETQTPETEGADFKVARVANGVRLYLNANADHGIMQMIGVENVEEANLDDLPPNGEHVIAQVAYTADQLSTLSYQLQTLSQEIVRLQQAKAGGEAENDGEAE
jgi:hypothetical protein